MITVLGEPAALIDFGPLEFNGNPAVLTPPQYRLLKSHYLTTGWFDVDTIITEGMDVPIGWIPTLGVDPLNPQAVTAFYNAGPRSASSYEDVNEFENATRSRTRPVTFWKPVSGTHTYTLTGLGIGLPPKGP
jgi:hypothetical protein